MDKKYTLEAFKKYFDIIDSFFGSIRHYLGDEEDSHIDLGANMASYPLISDLIIDAIEDLDEEIDKFWEENAKNIFDFVKKEESLKCIYSGDITPVILENFVKKCALYVDTIIIPDPVFNLSIFHRQIYLDKKQYLNKLIRHVFNVWKLKDLILAETDEFIIVILPINIHVIKEEAKEELLANADYRFTDYVSKLTNREFSDPEDCFAFFEEQQTTINLFKNFKNLHLLPNAFKSYESLNQFLVKFNKIKISPEFDSKSITWSLGLYLKSQFVRVQEHKYFCNTLSAEPIYDYELPWFFYNYELGGLDMDAAIANSLQKENFKWINKVPITALKWLRENNRLDYMRSILRNGITDIKAKKDTDLKLVSEQLEKNLQEAFRKQSEEIQSLEKEVSNILKKEIPITTGGFLAGFIPYLSNVISICTAGRDIKEFLKQKKKAEDRLSEKENDFINLLLKTYNG